VRVGARGVAGLCAVAMAAGCAGLLGYEELRADEPGDGGAEASPDGAAPDAGPTADAGPCRDLLTNANHCGRCGHGCLGGECSKGTCQPFRLKGGIRPTSVVVDGARVYWLESYGARVGQLEKDGNGAIDLASSSSPGNSAPTGLAVDDANLVWGTVSGNILRCAIGGCAATPQPVSSSLAFRAAVLDSTNVYWLEGFKGDQGTIKRAPKGATNATPQELVGDAGPAFPAPLYRIAADLDALYVTSGDGSVLRVTKADGGVATVGQGLGQAFAIAIDDANVYWTGFDDPGAIYKAPKAGGATTSLASGEHSPIGVAVDRVHIYWATPYVDLGDNSGTIRSCSLAACNTDTRTLAENQAQPVAIAVDDDAIYWASAGADGGLMKLAKP